MTGCLGSKWTGLSRQTPPSLVSTWQRGMALMWTIPLQRARVATRPWHLLQQQPGMATGRAFCMASHAGSETAAAINAAVQQRLGVKGFLHMRRFVPEARLPTPWQQQQQPQWAFHHHLRRDLHQQRLRCHLQQQQQHPLRLLKGLLTKQQRHQQQQQWHQQHRRLHSLSCHPHLQQLATASRAAAGRLLVSAGCSHYHPAATAAAAAAAVQCWEACSFHVRRWGLSVGATLLTALQTVGPHLPTALGLCLAEWLSQGRTAWAEAPHSAPPTSDASPASSSGSAASGQHPAGQVTQRSKFDRFMDSVSAGARLIWLLCLFLPLIAATPFALQWGYLPRAWWMQLLRGTLEAAGPAFIKWGQWAATRHDLFPPDMCSALEALHASAPAHSAHYTVTIIHRSFGLPASDLFEWLEPEPMASGSIGQIHRARLSRQGALLTGIPEGSLVAVKVRHPGVGAMIERDFKTMVWMAHVAGELMPAAKQLRLEDTLKQFAAPLHEQVDLSREARNLYRFNHNFRHARTVNFPTPYYPLVSPDVLVESFEAGRHISAFIVPGRRHPYSHRLAELGSGTMLQMMLVDNLIHADLHPGNILVQLDVPKGLLGLAYDALASISGSAFLPLAPAVRQHLRRVQASWLQPRLVLLDVGMATELSPEDQTNMLGLFKCFAALDGRGAGGWILRFAGEEQTCEAPEAFLSDLEETFDELRKTQVLGWDNAHFDSGADALASVLESVRMHGVSLPGHICAVVVTTLILEGWSNQLDPSHSVLTQVQGMFEPQNFNWKERMCHVVDKVMDRDDTAFAMA